MTRAERRWRRELATSRAAKIWLRWNKPRGGETGLLRGWDFDNGVMTKHYYTAAEIARGVAHLAETHGRPCSCWLCASHKDVPPRRERAFSGM